MNFIATKMARSYFIERPLLPDGHMSYLPAHMLEQSSTFTLKVSYDRNSASREIGLSLHTMQSESSRIVGPS